MLLSLSVLMVNIFSHHRGRVSFVSKTLDRLQIIDRAFEVWRYDEEASKALRQIPLFLESVYNY